MPRPGTWRHAVNTYSTALAAAGRSPGTIKVHRHYLDLLRRRHPLRPWPITTADLRALLATPHWSPETRKSCRTALRGFYGWATEAGYLSEDPARTLAPVRVPFAPPRPAPEDLVHALIGHAGDPRLALMAMLAALAGLRRGEIARVHAHDLDGNVLIVRGKGGRVRHVPIADPKLLARLQALDGWAFPSPAPGHEHLTPGCVGKLLARAMPDHWTAHTLRHRMATRAYAGTGDLLAVQQLLGHSRPETTQRYVQLDASRVLTAAAAALVEEP